MKRPAKTGKRGDSFGKGRSFTDYSRRAGNRSSKIIWIVCEGSETEPNYFKALKALTRMKNVEVRIAPGGKGKTSPATLVEKAKEKLKIEGWDPGEGDEAWCVFDVERKGTHPDLFQVIENARAAQIKVVISNPSFEYWFLLHFDKTDRSFIDAEEVCKALQKHIPNYSHSMPVYPCLKDHTDTALKNASDLRSRSEKEWKDYPNPSTGADILVEYLLAIINEG